MTPGPSVARCDRWVTVRAHLEVTVGEELRTAAALAAFTLVDDGVVVVAVDAGAGYPVVDANPASARMTGRDLDAIVGHPLAELEAARMVAGFERRVHEVLRSGRADRVQVVDEVPAGRVTLDVSLCPLPELGDDPPHVLLVLRDVTPLLRTIDVLDEVERVTRTGTWTWDVIADTVRWSSQLYELFGVARDQMEPSLAGYLQRVHPDDRDEVETAITHTFETGAPFDLEHRVVTPDEQVRRLHCTGRRVAGLDGRPVRMSGTARLVDGTAD